MLPGRRLICWRRAEFSNLNYLDCRAECNNSLPLTRTFVQARMHLLFLVRWIHRDEPGGVDASENVRISEIFCCVQKAANPSPIGSKLEPDIPGLWAVGLVPPGPATDKCFQDNFEEAIGHRRFSISSQPSPSSVARNSGLCQRSPGHHCPDAPVRMTAFYIDVDLTN
ncbi:MAG: hypothetical protein JWM11_6181 [Planctomycetaceae bacterium]|nr:hypothetical protein [Planctomycetaceae bacterium]